MALLLSTIAAGLVVWTALALGAALVLGRICAHRERQVCRRHSPADMHPAMPVHVPCPRSPADAVEHARS